MQALGIFHKTGKVRESFVASMLSFEGALNAPKKGGFLLNRKYLFEVGGKIKIFLKLLICQIVI